MQSKAHMEWSTGNGTSGNKTVAGSLQALLPVGISPVGRPLVSPSICHHHHSFLGGLPGHSRPSPEILVNGLIGALSSTLYRKPAPRDSTDWIAGPVTTSAWHLTAVQHCSLLLCQLPWDVAAHTPLDSQQCDNSRTIGHGSAF